jgi:iron complex transport system permease protein
MLQRCRRRFRVQRLCNHLCTHYRPAPGARRSPGLTVMVRRLTLARMLGICLVLAAVLLAIVLLALRLGAVPFSFGDLAQNLLLLASGHPEKLSVDFRLIMVDIRLPRILLGIVVGAALSVAGASFQALLRNPLADPYVLGVSSGAALGAILALLVLPALPLMTPLAAFLGAIATIAAVYFLGRREGQLDSSTLLLAGIISASFLSAVIMFLMMTLASRDVRGIAFWLMGDLSASLPPGLLWILVVGFILAAGAIFTTASDLNLILAGEREAMHLGVDVMRVKLVVYVSASILTGLAVSVGGAIGYVGLLVPHVMRMLFGSDYRVLIPTSALGGAIAIVLADTLARTIVAPTELPVGAMTAMAGAPVFIYLLRRRLS